MFDTEHKKYMRLLKTEPPHTSLDIKEVFTPAGFISRSLTGFEVRPQQVEMAGAIQRVILDGRHLAVEAGTGVGKSFAYLIPTIELVCRTGSKALISTYTITLQGSGIVTGSLSTYFQAVKGDRRSLILILSLPLNLRWIGMQRYHQAGNIGNI